MTLNLTEVSAARAKMTPGDLTHHQKRDDGELVFDAVFAADGNSIAYDINGDDADWDPGNAAGIVAEHNAMPVVLELAIAAKVLEAAQVVSSAARTAFQHAVGVLGRDELIELECDVEEASRQESKLAGILTAALAKISL